MFGLHIKDQFLRILISSAIFSSIFLYQTEADSQDIKFDYAISYSISKDTQSDKTFAKDSKIENKVIYGADDRLDLYQVVSSTVYDSAKATAILVESNKIERMNSEVSKLRAKTFAETYSLCEEEPFREQLTLGFCSGFLISDTIFVTAGHCLRTESQCQKTQFVFDFAMTQTQQDLSEISNENIYGCKRLLHSEVNGTGSDFAIVELDRSVKSRRPLPMRRMGQIQPREPIYVIGYPSGIPVKIAAGAQVRSLSQGFFTANLDTYGGNSGSAVLNENTGEVEGILVRGASDFVYKNNCRSSNICEDEGCRGEDVTYIGEILKHLPQP
jgi:hypothetical protein